MVRNQVLEKFREATEKDFQLASRKLWPTICLAQAVFGEGVELLIVVLYYGYCWVEGAL